MIEKDILSRLQSTLSPKRFRHVRAVSRWAEALARRHGQSPARARLAGLLHDCGKEIPGPTQAVLVQKWRLPVPGRDFILATGHLGLFHAHVSAALAEREYGVKDKAVLSAIRAHTFGAEDMSVLDRLFTIADFSSADRTYPAARAIRRAALKDLDAAFRETIRWKLRYVLEAGGAIHPVSVGVWNRWRRP